MTTTTIKNNLGELVFLRKGSQIFWSENDQELDQYVNSDFPAIFLKTTKDEFVMILTNHGISFTFELNIL